MPCAGLFLHGQASRWLVQISDTAHSSAPHCSGPMRGVCASAPSSVPATTSVISTGSTAFITEGSCVYDTPLKVYERQMARILGGFWDVPQNMKKERLQHGNNMMHIQKIRSWLCCLLTFLYYCLLNAFYYREVEECKEVWSVAV